MLDNSNSEPFTKESVGFVVKVILVVVELWTVKIILSPSLLVKTILSS